MTNASTLELSGSVQLATVNGIAGYGLIRFAPAGEKWEIQSIYAECSSKISEARCLVYVNSVAPQNARCGTYSGSSGDNASGSPIYLNDGQPLYVEWTGGDNDGLATVTMTGWKSEPAGGFRAIH